MSRSAVSQVHYGLLGTLVDGVGVQVLLEVVRRTRVVTELYSFRTGRAVLRGKYLAEVIGGVVYNKRRRPCEISMCPRVCKDVHRDAGVLQ